MVVRVLEDRRLGSGYLRLFLSAMEHAGVANELQENRGRAFVGTIEEHVQGKGWFFGAFMNNPLLRSDLVEVAWQRLPNLAPSPDQAHFHDSSVEINLVLQGWIALTIDQTRHHLTKGQGYVVWPGAVVADLTTGDDTELVVIRAPSGFDKQPA